MRNKKPAGQKLFRSRDIIAQSYAFLALKMQIFGDIMGLKRPYSVYNYRIYRPKVCPGDKFHIVSLFRCRIMNLVHFSPCSPMTS